MSTCSYKFIGQQRAIQHVQNTYRTLVNKESAPINTIMYNGQTALKKTEVVRNTRVTEEWKNGRLNGKIYNYNDLIVGIVIIVKSYRDHVTHAICAVKYNDILLCFNSWGQDALPVDKIIFNDVKKLYHCSRTIMYEGISLQIKDPFGVCVGYASNFMLEMLIKIEAGQMPSNISQKAYDEYVYKVLTSRGICFGRKCVKSNSSLNQWRKMENNLILQNDIIIDESILNKMKLKNLIMLAKKHKIAKYSKLQKENLKKKLRSEIPFTRKQNLENIEFQNKNSSPQQVNKINTPPHFSKNPTPQQINKINTPPRFNKNPTPQQVNNNLTKTYKLKHMTVAQLKKYASNKKMKGRSAFTRKENLIKFIKSH